MTSFGPTLSPFLGLSDLHLGNRKVTLKKLIVDDICISFDLLQLSHLFFREGFSTKLQARGNFFREEFGKDHESRQFIATSSRRLVTPKGSFSKGILPKRALIQVKDLY